MVLFEIILFCEYNFKVAIYCTFFIYSKMLSLCANK
jgi:hypothetical protein